MAKPYGWKGAILRIDLTSGEKQLLPTQEFNLVITDINMPDINGLELINFIKNNERYNPIPLIIVSTERSEEDKKRGIALGAMAYITKPFKAQELQETIQQALSP